MNKLADTLHFVGVGWACGNSYVADETDAGAIAELVALGLVEAVMVAGEDAGYRPTAKGEQLWGWLKTDDEVRAHGVEVQDAE